MRCRPKFVCDSIEKNTFWRKNVQNSRKTCLQGRLPGRWPTGLVGGWGRLYSISLSINKVQMLKGVCKSIFALRNNPKLTKIHVRRPVSRRPVSQLRNVSTFWKNALSQARSWPTLADQPKVCVCVCVCVSGMFSLFVSNKVHFWYFNFTNKESYFDIWSRDGASSPPFIRCPPLLKVML